MEPIDNTGLTDIAVAWVETLRARGVSLRVKGKRLEWLPGSAYKEMSDEELLTFRHHRTAIVNVVRERYAGTVRAAPLENSGTVSPPVAEPERCTWCGRAPCIGEGHEYFAVLHPHHQPPPWYDLAALRHSNGGLRVVP